jgi:hypothetical protein
MRKHLGHGAAIAFAGFVSAMLQLGSNPSAWAQQAQPPAAAAPVAPAPAVSAPAPAPAAPASNAMATPSMTGPLVANPNPLSIPNTPLGNIYFNGAISGIGLFQTSPETYLGDHTSQFDISDGLLSLQNTTGIFQFFAQAGVYSFPEVGTPYLHSWRTTGDFFGPVPVVYGKLVPNDTISFEVGKLPTLIGAEYGFTFQNMNIERGLLWGQEPIVSHGVQGNYTWGPVALSLSLNDGFYSGDYDWLSGSATWTIDKLNTLELVVGGNFSRNSVSHFTSTPPFAAITPVPQDNSTILNLIYTYSNAPWTITPYFQYTHVPSNTALGLADSSTYGGAVLASYQLNENWSLAGRAEVIGSSGPGFVGGAGLLGYGPGSGAFSFTVTPTWQRGIFFARAEGSVVTAFSTTAGDVFGSTGTTKTQGRFLLEGGIVF